jgi:hypothetical protein
MRPEERGRVRLLQPGLHRPDVLDKRGLRQWVRVRDVDLLWQSVGDLRPALPEGR